ncbi:DDE-type integrase/transposase/recombinase, partial [Nonomuraea basaltis]
MRGGRGIAGHLVPQEPPEPRPGPARHAPKAAPGRTVAGRARPRPRGAERAVRRRLPGDGVLLPAGCGPLPGLAINDVPDPAPARRGRPGSATSGHPPAQDHPRAVRRCPQPRVGLGHHPDITKLRGPDKGVWYSLYTIIDIYSRYVVGWMIAPRESADLAKHLIGQTTRKHHIDEGTLTLHADRGSSMKSKTVAELLIDLGVAKSHSRPKTSNDNPHVEASYKTLKYCPDFPGRFGSIADARAFCQSFYTWYNHNHYHSGIGYHHPVDVHYGRAAAVRDRTCRRPGRRPIHAPRTVRQRRPPHPTR